MATKEQVQHYAALTAEAIAGELAELGLELERILGPVAPTVFTLDALAGAVSTDCTCHDCRVDGGRPADLVNGRPVEVRPMAGPVPSRGPHGS